MSTISSSVFSILNNLINLNISDITSFLKVKNDSLFLISNDSILLKINKDSFFLGEDTDLSHKISVENTQPENFMLPIDNIVSFFKDISITRLNHLGISYHCDNFDSEIEEYRKHLKKSDYKLYEEPADNDFQKWLFIGNVNSWKAPLFEVVLNKGDKVTEWLPHFQIDIDTSLSFDELKDKTQSHFRSDFFKWQLDVPDYGIVLGMGSLGSVNKTKLYLGIGTKIRDTKFHRQNILKQV